MTEQILPIVAWAGLIVLAILCLPVARKFVLELSALVLRLAMLALLAGGAYLWFRPDAMPAGFRESSTPNRGCSRSFRTARPRILVFARRSEEHTSELQSLRQL